MRYCFGLLVLLFVYTSVTGQDPLRFEQEIKVLKKTDSLVDTQNLILFTGSSSIRFWQDLKTDFPNHNVLNRGFGGSEMSDLLYYLDVLVLPYQPSKIFIYEGDNDINSGKTPEQILKTAEEVVSKIRAVYPTIEIVFISPKPSIARWHLSQQYEDFNHKLKLWTSKREGLRFVDVWSPMLDGSGEVRKDVFIEDKLHLNRLGYDIWKNAISALL